jgi:predicted secreted acid phosphatase
MKNPAIIIDIDGTLANIEHRVHYVRNGRKDWPKFFQELHKDTVRQDVKAVYDLYYALRNRFGLQIILVSGRGAETELATRKWLLDNGIAYSALYMRRKNDYRDDTVIKEEIYHQYIEPRYNTILVIDDRPKVVRMWQRNRLNVLDVGNGVEF